MASWRLVMMLSNEHQPSGACRLETFRGDGLGSFMSRFEGWARKGETGESLDSVRAVLVEVAFSIRDFELDAAPELGAQGVVTVTTWDLGDDLTVPVLLSESFWTSTVGSDNCRFSTCVGYFDEVRETVAAVSVDDSEGDFPWKSVLRALDSSWSIRELREFCWSSRGIKRKSGFNELGRVWERVIRTRSDGVGDSEVESLGLLTSRQVLGVAGAIGIGEEMGTESGSTGAVDTVSDPLFLPRFTQKRGSPDLCISKSVYQDGALGYALRVLWRFGKRTRRASLQFKQYLGTSHLNSFRSWFIGCAWKLVGAWMSLAVSEDGCAYRVPMFDQRPERLGYYFRVYRTIQYFTLPPQSD
ncbi:hypothetical protein F5887DRAFT_920330 [Amanita rubescens]|nr:hypothetical protein F5887DRAFT_920330 [Amanita rubescens]